MTRGRGKTGGGKDSYRCEGAGEESNQGDGGSGHMPAKECKPLINVHSSPISPPRASLCLCSLILAFLF